MRKVIWLAVAIVVVALVVLLSTTAFFTDWLWYKSLNFVGVFWTAFLTGWAVRLFAFSLSFVFISLNLGLACRAFRRLPAQEESIFAQFKLGEAPLIWINVLASVVLAFFLSAVLNPGWPAVQQFLHPVRVGVTDPVFHLDLGYYLFRFPVWLGLNRLLQGLCWVALFGVGFIYLASRAFWRQGRNLMLWPQAKAHLTGLAVLLFLVKIWSYQLARQGLLFVNTGLMTGIDYTAAHVRLPVYNILAWIAVLCIAFLLWSLFRRGTKLLFAGVGLLLAASIVLGGLYPALVKAVVVGPNEFAKERAYLSRHITATRRAYGLDRFLVQGYQLGRGVEPITLDSPTIANLRLWDFRALQLSYEQLQTLRPYYTFNDVDIDRYRIAGRERSVMLSARELDASQLPASAKNWLNLHLAYTHGYGLTMSSVSDVNEEGQPVFLVGDIPPLIMPASGLPKLVEPRIYFGETQNEYVIAPNGNREFDYPTKSEENELTDFAGRDGVSLRSFWTRLLLALRFGDFNFVLSGYIKPESKVLLYRRVADRARKLAPFLDFDSDPYVVMADGRLYWLIDAYTYSSYYPYSARHPETGLNYVRNSVKVVVDAYEGTVRYYVTDAADPIIRVWQRIFPRLFTPLGEMPAGLRAHLRYPERLFRLQRDMLLTYHMTDMLTFFRKEDAWAVPTETYTGTEEELAPYYLTLRLPGERDGEFVLMQPLKPSAQKRKNMIAWMAARCDGEHYGEVLVYLLPKDKLIYGPIQVEGRIAQNPEVSKMYTLWGQQQSSILRGNLLVLPFAGDFLYVEPTYIVSEQGQQPELKLVVLVLRDRIAYGATLSEAVAQLSGFVRAPVASGATTPGPAAVAGPARDQFVRLLQQLEESIRAQQDALRRQQQILSDLKQEAKR